MEMMKRPSVLSLLALAPRRQVCVSLTTQLPRPVRRRVAENVAGNLLTTEPNVHGDR